MKRIAAIFLLAASAFAAPLATSARNATPKDVQQIISVDYRRLHDSPTAVAMKAKLLPDNLKQFEVSLRQAGINPDTDVDSLTFVTYRHDKSLRIVGFATGGFQQQVVLKKFTVKKVKPLMVRTNKVWPMGGGMQMCFLDATTLAFGEPNSLRNALDVRDGEAEGLNSNSEVLDQIASASDGMVWSVLDQIGTQNLMRAALGEAAGLADYNVVKKRLLASRYTMDFTQQVAFNLDVTTSDSMTATALSSLVKAGVMYRRMAGSGPEKSALDGVSVESDSSRLRLAFRADDNKFKSLMGTDLFAAVTR